ncbi:unnamed protein product [Arabidopsis halleri]
MKVVAAFLLAVLSGKASPTSADIKIILGSGLFSRLTIDFTTMFGVESEDAQIELLLKEVKGKDLAEVIASGREKLASVPSGGGGSGVAVSSAPFGGGGGGGAPAAESKKEENNEEKEESDDLASVPSGGGGSGVAVSSAPFGGGGAPAAESKKEEKNEEKEESDDDMGFSLFE